MYILSILTKKKIFSDFNREKMASNMQQQGKPVPKDALVVMSILKDMGIAEYEPQVVTQLLEFTYSKYLSTYLQ